jgi:hypothetical protein
MKNIITTLFIIGTLFLGCSTSTDEVDTNVKAEKTVEKQTQPKEVVATKVIINNAKSETVLVENQVKTNVSYTHFSVSGARYQHQE